MGCLGSQRLIWHFFIQYEIGFWTLTLNTRFPKFGKWCIKGDQPQNRRMHTISRHFHWISNWRACLTMKPQLICTWYQEWDPPPPRLVGGTLKCINMSITYIISPCCDERDWVAHGCTSYLSTSKWMSPIICS